MRKRSNGEMNKASKEIALTSSLPAHDAGFLFSCPLWVHGTLCNIFFSPGGANWGSSQAQKGEASPEVLASSHQPFPEFHMSQGKMPLGSEQHCGRCRSIL